MSRLFPLESFSGPRPGSGSAEPVTYTAEDLETARLEAYDRGYQSGWDDAVQQNRQDQLRIGEEFARNLQDLSFTYHEARAHVVHSMEQLARSLIDALFPDLAAEAIAHHVSAAISDHAELAGKQPMILRVSPDDHPALQAIVPEVIPFPLEIIAETAQTVGQVHLIMGQSEFQIDLTDIVTAARSALDALHESNERMLKHG